MSSHMILYHDEVFPVDFDILHRLSGCGRKRAYGVQEGVRKAQLVHNLALQHLCCQNRICDADTLQDTLARSASQQPYAV